MVALAVALASWLGDPVDAAIGPWLEAAAPGSPTTKYEALGRGLSAIDQKRYSPKRADTAGLLYGSLLAADVPAVTKWHVCRALAAMDGLDRSVDDLLRLAGQYKAAAAARKQAERAVFRAAGPVIGFRTGVWPDEERLADDLIAALWTRKSGGQSHLSGALVRFPPPVGGMLGGFSR
jgi:hypothetical protein